MQIFQSTTVLISNNKQFLLGLILFSVFLLKPVDMNAQTPGVETAGDVTLVTLPATAIATTLLIKDHEGLGQFAEGFFLNKILTFSIKGIVGRERPDGDGFDSFPSGHTSTTFQSASFIQRRYGWKYGIPAYALATFTGFSRVNADRHYVADVLVVAALGIGCTYVFTTPYEKQDYQVNITGDTNGFLVGFSYRF
jgi:membrane-associated phospholipid phosphatase